MGWLTGYLYRKKGAVNATAAGAQTNYQMQLLVGESSGAAGEDVDVAGNCQDFPNDIRFTGADELTKHDYWVESVTGTTPNQLATIWIEVASIPASGDVDLYMYYGKSSDSGESSGDNTFVIYNMPNVVAFWHMDEASWNGTPDEVEDETGVNDGVSCGGVNTVAGGKFNRCGDFDGSDDYIDCGNDASLNITDEITIVAWINTSAADKRQAIVTKGQDAGGGTIDELNYHLGARGDLPGDKLYFEIFKGVEYFFYYANSDIIDGQWHHVVVAAKSENSGTFYVDGSPDGNFTPETLISNTHVLEIGSWEEALTNRNFQGKIDEVVIYNRKLSADEITALHENYMQKMGSYYNVREWASPEPTWGTWGGQTTVGTRCYAFIIG